MSAPRPPLLARWLAGCIRGHESDIVRGDLQEIWEAEGAAAGAPRRAYLRNVVATLIAWWSPAAIGRRRRRSRGRAAGGPIAGGRGHGPSGWVLALRGIRRRARASAVVVGTLGLGIGAVTAVFSVVDGVLLRPLPYPGAERLVAVGATFPDREWRDDGTGLQYLAGVSWPNLAEVQASVQAFDRVVSIHRQTALLPEGPRGPELVGMAAVSEGYFELFGARPELGRLFDPADHAGENGEVVVLSHAAWVTRYGADPEVIGRATASGAASTIVGVLSPDFVAPGRSGFAAELWTPLDTRHARYASRSTRSLDVFARLSPATELAEARSELDAIATRLAREWPDGNVRPDGSHLGWGANPLQADTVGGAGRTLWVFLGAAALLLAIAVLNAMNLLFVRALERRADRAVHAALGASRATLVRHQVIESLVLSAGAGMVGALLASLAVTGLRTLAPDLLPRLGSVSVDLRVLAQVTLVSAAVGIAAGLLPGLTAGVSGTPGRPTTRTVAGGRGRLMRALVAAQLALALVLATGAAQLMRSFMELRAVDPGFDAEGLVTFRMPAKRGDAQEAGWQAWDALLREVREIPGVRAAGAASNLPFESPNWAPSIRHMGAAPDEMLTGIGGFLVTPGYLETLGVPLVRGRMISESDGPEAEPVMLLNETFVDLHLRDRDPIGLRLRVGPEEAVTRVVGVVGDVIQTSPEEGARPAVYLPHRQGGDWPWIRAALQIDPESPSVDSAVRAAGARYASHLPLDRLARMEDLMAGTRAEPRVRMLLLLGFAGVALLLAATGIYAMQSHTVALRRREMSLRMALGADRSDILGLILRGNLAIAAVGLSVGLGAAWLAAGTLSRFLYRVPPHDPGTFVAAALTLAATTLIAGWAPALRATRSDPAEALDAP